MTYNLLSSLPQRHQSKCSLKSVTLSILSIVTDQCNSEKKKKNTTNPNVSELKSGYITSEQYF